MGGPHWGVTRDIYARNHINLLGFGGEMKSKAA
jgi:hypothetical protein